MVERYDFADKVVGEFSGEYGGDLEAGCVGFLVEVIGSQVEAFAPAALIALAIATIINLAANVRQRRPLMATTLLPLLGFLAIAYTLPLYENVHLWGVGDWTEVVAHYSSARHSLAAVQFPLWNPYFCGGNPLWGNPQAYWPSLSFLLTLPFGDIIGTKIAITLYIFLGMWGMHRLTRHLGLSNYASLLAAIIFTLSTYLSSKIAAGQMAMLTIVWIPWVIYHFLRSIKKTLAYSSRRALLSLNYTRRHDVYCS